MSVSLISLFLGSLPHAWDTEDALKIFVGRKKERQAELWIPLGTSYVSGIHKAPIPTLRLSGSSILLDSKELEALYSLIN